MCFFLLYYFIFSETLEGGLNAYIGTDEKAIVLSELVDVPSFLRFDTVILNYIFGYQSFAQKCESFHGHLSSIKTTLYDSNVISFSLGIDQEDPTDFYNDSTLIEHIRHIVSICDSSCGYDFRFQSYADSSTFGNLIASILGIPEIARSSFVSISGCYYAYTNMQLPVETISNWLNRERNGASCSVAVLIVRIFRKCVIS